MNPATPFLFPLALLLPASTGADGPARAPVEHGPAAAQARSLESFRQVEPQAQVRIEQRVIIRIAPSTAATRAEMLSGLPRRSEQVRFREKKADKCVPVQAILGVQPSAENRLLLFMRDRRIISAALEKACSAQSFYSGFYLERSDDGMLCTGRDVLRSRAGANCEVARFSHLVAVDD